MTRVFVFTNHKGTSATSIAFGIGALLRKAEVSNCRVLLIDTDSQAHATLVTTGSKDYGADNSLYTVWAIDNPKLPSFRQKLLIITAVRSIRFVP